ncbi:hypothetical protein PVL29_024975 [Vitis rotundifolia]|uniref:H(+)-exporting diphosphatase n=1 Tax=Vitis rotundifolia TaxID=103349 RepID=A0AA39DAG2_VITRO|nr:hypothetical protein PVL29_024975 [Vitis rotundifolia]
MVILSDLGTKILVPACAIVRIVFYVFSLKRHLLSNSSKNGTTEYLIEEEKGLNDHSVVYKCAEIQNTISKGATSFLFTKYMYVRIFMFAFTILIFVLLGSMKGFSTKSQPCSYNEGGIIFRA